MTTTTTTTNDDDNDDNDDNDGDDDDDDAGVVFDVHVLLVPLIFLHLRKKNRLFIKNQNHFSPKKSFPTFCLELIEGSRLELKATITHSRLKLHKTKRYKDGEDGQQPNPH